MSSSFVTRLLLATDFSETAARAEQYAMFLAGDCRAAVDVVHVIEPYPGMDAEFSVNHLYLEEIRKESERHLEAIEHRGTNLGLAVQTHQIIGRPSEQIIESANICRSDLIVLGTHGWTGLKRVLLGSTAERVIAGASCPVLAVRQPRTRAESTAVPISLERILVPIDFSECSIEALEYAALLAQQFKGSVTILHVLELISYGLDFTLHHEHEQEKAKEQAESRLASHMEAFKSFGVPSHTALRSGTPADGILCAIDEQGYDLVVMGTHGRRGLSHLVNGSVAEAVLRRASCPILTVKRLVCDLGHTTLFQQGREPMKKSHAVKPNRINETWQAVEPIELHDGMGERIRAKAYELYEGRGRQDGYALDDWLQAEAMVMEEARDV